MAINLNNCSQECFGCIKAYKNKNELKKGEPFSIKCNGIPKNYIDPSIVTNIGKESALLATSMVDPVAWAAETLDWHCLDPDGEVWKRKNPEEYYSWVNEHPGESILGKSRYHREYQKLMLQCTGKRKVFRIGRQAGKSEALIVSMLFNLFTKPGVSENEGFKIVVITPFQTQIDLIFGRLNELISGSKTLSNSITKNNKAPNYVIQLQNNSIIRGFTAGTKSGQNAGAVRGQSAHMLVFDEADYLSSGDMDAAMSIVTNYPNATVWMSSTPTGKRERFYDTCRSKRYKEFHFPSSVNPMWSAELEANFRDELTEIGYKHEVLADFGEQEEGVFQNVYIQKAKEDYKYGDFPYDQNWTYILGVDWNDTANGTTIAVIGFSPQMRKFVLVNRYIVSRDGWTQRLAMEKIVELNRFWRPLAIYVDRGYGSTQYELLREFGFNALADKEKGPMHPDSKLRDIVKQYDFGSTIETHDPFTKQKMKKAAKPFLVESTVRRFEAGDFVFSEYDEILEKQLHGYVIDRITPGGMPVYKPIDANTGDHTLDAVMLALIGFTLEISPFGKVKYDSKIAFSGKFGEKIEGLSSSGDLVINHSNKDTLVDQREHFKPNNIRSSFGNDNSLLKNELPANHVGNNSVRVWSHDGFLRDGKKPTKKHNAFTSRRSRKPSRSNF